MAVSLASATGSYAKPEDRTPENAQKRTGGRDCRPPVEIAFGCFTRGEDDGPSEPGPVPNTPDPPGPPRARSSPSSGASCARPREREPAPEPERPPEPERAPEP